MHQVTLKAEKRVKTGKEGNKKLRKEGMVSGVVYGKGLKENVLVKVNAKDMGKALTTSAGARVIFNLEVDDNGKKETYTTMAVDVHKDIYKKVYFNIDFHLISLKEKVTTEVPVNLTGESRGVKLGGMMDQVLRTVTVRALPLDIPESIEYDVTEMDENDQLKAKDLTIGKDVEILDDPEEVIAVVHPPKVAETAGETEGGAVAGVATPETAGVAGE
jgi:large subunit ribosomal protein L25